MYRVSLRHGNAANQKHQRDRDPHLSRISNWSCRCLDINSDGVESSNAELKCVVRLNELLFFQHKPPTRLHRKSPAKKNVWHEALNKKHLLKKKISRLPTFLLFGYTKAKKKTLTLVRNAKQFITKYLRYNRLEFIKMFLGNLF